MRGRPTLPTTNWFPMLRTRAAPAWWSSLNRRHGPIHFASATERVESQPNWLGLHQLKPNRTIGHRQTEGSLAKSLVKLFRLFGPGFSRHGSYQSDETNEGRTLFWFAPNLIVLMSSSGYPSARLLPSRAGFRFTRGLQLNQVSITRQGNNAASLIYLHRLVKN